MEQFMEQDPSLQDFNLEIIKYRNLEDTVNDITVSVPAGPIALMTGGSKFDKGHSRGFDLEKNIKIETEFDMKFDMKVQVDSKFGEWKLLSSMFSGGTS